MVGAGEALDVLVGEVVLGLAPDQLVGAVDEENLALTLGRLRAVDDQNAGGDAGAVEEVGPQADDGLDQVVLEEALPDRPSAPPRKRTPCGRTTPSRPSSRRLATMCWTKA